ncbi:MAG: undecaprenyldiphospho-muramoylpentapeptide beta-N-acetylglucosaminyltransferase [Peptostreptococcaceae bacterium]|jgi:undecaprenyldiphospho-muramoylpentapeptide beta-N-acetylglucosaminyltransferase|nr:undecaprenyldiphospho-muramoylpentapeptide beta-N-acetylglucosaminyltransferase [Peptostreptococcaceae bacterium]
MKLIVCGGGTGGHIYPALSIADYFVSQNENTDVLYIGGKYGIENSIVPSYGYRFETIDVKGFQRKISKENIKRVLKSISSMIKMRKIISKEKPDIVIGTGGYVSGPVVYIASLMGVKTAILEQNVFMGMTNKILSKKVDYIFYGFEESTKRYNFKNAIVSGNPIRISKFSQPKEYCRKILSYENDEKIILSVGGSGGFENLNNSIKDFASYCKNHNIRLIHVCGKDYYDDMKDIPKEIDYEKFELFPYLKDIATYICACDIVICSSGASTLSEVTYAGKPIIALPKAYTAENHQEYNAKMIQDNGAGYYIKEQELNSDILIQKITFMLQDDNIRKMSINSKKLYNKDACEIIYNTVMK